VQFFGLIGKVLSCKNPETGLRLEWAIEAHVDDFSLTSLGTMNQVTALTLSSRSDRDIKLFTRTWVLANLFRIENLLIFGYVLFASLSTSLLVPLHFLITFSVAWFLVKMLRSWLTVIIIVTLSLIPFVGWLVLIVLFCLRLKWFARNFEACIVSLVLVVLPMFHPAGNSQKYFVIGVLLLSVFLSTYLFSRGYSAIEFLDIFLTVPAALIAIGMSVNHAISKAGGDHDGDFQKTNRDPNGVIKPIEKSTSHDHPQLQEVKAHVRTQPDGNEANNLSYTGPHAEKPSGPYVHVSSYVRTEADGSVANNLSGHQLDIHDLSTHSLAKNPVSSHDVYASSAQLYSATKGFSYEISNFAITSLIAPETGRSVFSDRYIRIVTAAKVGGRRRPFRLVANVVRSVVKADRKQFLHSFQRPGISQWDRFKEFVLQSQDVPFESWSGTHRAELSSARVAAFFDFESERVLAKSPLEQCVKKPRFTSQIVAVVLGLYGSFVGIVSFLVILHTNRTTSWENAYPTSDLSGTLLLKIIEFTGLQSILVNRIWDEIPYGSGKTDSYLGTNRLVASIFLVFSIIVVRLIAPKIARFRTRRNAS
jgi:hypothetical protein